MEKWEYQNKPCYLENCHYVASLEKPKTLIQPFFLVWMAPGLNIGRGHYRSATQMEILKKKCLEDLTTFFISTWWGDSKNMEEIEF